MIDVHANTNSSSLVILIPLVFPGYPLVGLVVAVVGGHASWSVCPESAVNGLGADVSVVLSWPVWRTRVCKGEHNLVHIPEIEQSANQPFLGFT